MKSSDEFLKIDTPENVGFDYEIAGIGSRFIAALIDSLIIGIALIVVNFVLFLLTTVYEASTMRYASWGAAISGLLSFALFWGYYIYYEIRTNGQSIGKRRIGIRVMRRDGTPISATESVTRNLVRIVDFLPVAYGLGVTVMFINEQSCRLGDLAASTLVVYDRGEIPITSLQSAAPSAMLTPFEESVRSWPLDRLDTDDLQLAQSFLHRRHELANAQALAGPILARLITKIGVEERAYFEYDVIFVIKTIVTASGER